MNKRIITASYAALRDRVRKTLVDGRRRIEQERVRVYWEAGRIIHTHILKNRGRAGYGDQVVLRLAKDLGVDRTVLSRCIKFAEVYPRAPIGARGHQFKWSHYRRLITVSDEKRRGELARTALHNGWSVQELTAHIKKTRPPAGRALRTAVSPSVPRLTSTRGQPGIYALRDGEIDFGFKVRFDPRELGFFRVPQAEYVEIPAAKNTQLKRAVSGQDELFTYRAAVVKIVDGDTLVAGLRLGLGLLIEQRLRLRGIDCPEAATREGKKAKQFVTARLKGCGFIIVKTHQDRSDKFDRYLTDVFYLPGENNPAVAAKEGHYLNQELLDAGLARIY